MSETIYNLVPREYIPPEKRPYPKSTHDPKAGVVGSTFGCHGTTRLYGAGELVKKDGALFGPPKADSGLPITQKSPKRTGNENGFGYTDKRKSPVPNKDDVPILGITTSKNFITANAVEAILQAPKPLASKELNYMKKEDFGKVPAYLSQVKEEIRRENDMIDRYVKEQMGQVEKTPETFEEFGEDERLELVAQLKAKWDSVNARYQKITHLVQLDTTGQIRRKETLERELATIEADIEKLERASNVLIRK